MRVFVCARDETGIQSLFAFDEAEDVAIDRFVTLLERPGVEVEEFLGQSLREVVLSNEAFFMEGS